MKECCQNCKNCKRIKLSKRVINEIGGNGVVSGFEIVKSGGFEESHYCDALAFEKDFFAIEVELNDMCEMFSKKNELEKDEDL